MESENIPDPMDAEQTWPTEEEIKEAEQERKRLVKKIPEGFSEYQAAWIPDCDAGNDLGVLADLIYLSFDKKGTNHHYIYRAIIRCERSGRRK